jgi:hypothetical protein
MISIETYGQDSKSFEAELKTGIHEWVQERINQRLGQG